MRQVGYEQRSGVFAVFMCVFVTVGCSADGGAGGSSGGGGSGGTIILSDVTFDPPSAPAGSTVKVFGLEVDACPLRTSEIRVAGETAPAVLNERHEVLMRVPLFYDEETKWAAPPGGPQDVDVFCKGTLVATFPKAIAITDLPPAPGTTEALVADYQQLVSDYKALTDALAPARRQRLARGTLPWARQSIIESAT